MYIFKINVKGGWGDLNAGPYEARRPLKFQRSQNLQVNTPLKNKMQKRGLYEPQNAIHFF